MEERYFSDLWYRIADLTPALHGEVRLERRKAPGRPHYIAFDALSGKTHHLPVAAALFLRRMDGETRIDDLWHGLVEDLGARAPSQGQVVRLLSQLHSADLIRTALPADVAELDERRGKKARQVTRQNLMGPMSFRVSLFDPDALLRLTLPLVRPLISLPGFLLWLALVAVAGVGAVAEWDRLAGAFSDRVWTASSIAIVIGTYVVMKSIHELGHGWVAKSYGAEVRDIGVMFLVFMPVPYVDATEVAALPSRYQWAAVSAAGIVVETALAAGAFLLWREMEPGLTRGILFNVMLVGGVSTVLVNGNPLLKFDGYFVMSDLMGLPNLAPRANRFWGDWTNKRLFGAEDVRPRRLSRYERAVYALYAPAALVYRIVLSLTIAVYVASSFFVVGVLLGIWALTLSLGRPVAKGLWHVITAPMLRRVRRRAVGLTAGAMAAVALLLFAVPVPHATLTQGVVWTPPGAAIRAGAAGRIERMTVEAGARVAQGDAVAVLEDPMADTRLAALYWTQEEARHALARDLVRSRAEARLTEIALRDAEQRHERERERAAARTLVAGIDGVFQPRQQLGDMTGRHLTEGALLGHVLPEGPQRVRIVLGQGQIATVTAGVLRAELRAADRPERAVPAEVIGPVSSGGFELPSPVLALDRGGPIATVPDGQGGRRTVERVFQFDLRWPEAEARVPQGGRVHVKLVHPWRPLGPRLVDWVRRRFLGGFDV